MLSTGVENLDASIGKANAWLADIDAGFGTSDRHLAYRVLRAWLHCLRDRLSVEVAAHFAAQLPELLRGLGDLRLVLYGAALTLVVLFMPGGIVQAARVLRARIDQRMCATGLGQ